MKFAMENSAGPNWGTPGCHHSKNAMGDKEWFTQTYCDADFVEMSLHKNPECTEWFDEIKFQFEKGESKCTKFGTSGYYITTKQNMNRMDPSMMDHEMPNIDWKNSTSCLDWDSTRLFTDASCGTLLDKETEMKFAMENSAGPNWGTEGCHHSKNFMGDKEWFTDTYCVLPH